MMPILQMWKLSLREVGEATGPRLSQLGFAVTSGLCYVKVTAGAPGYLAAEGRDLMSISGSQLLSSSASAVRVCAQMFVM